MSVPDRGITNGIDVNKWNPETDQHLPAKVRYSSATVAAGKAAAKALIQQQHGLTVSPGSPLVGMVGRLAPQKGTDVLLAALPALLGCISPHLTEPQRDSSMEFMHPTPSARRCTEPLQLALLGSGLILNPSLCCICKLSHEAKSLNNNHFQLNFSVHSACSLHRTLMHCSLSCITYRDSV